MRNLIVSFLSGLVALASAGATQAQQTVQAGSVVDGRVAQGQAECFILPTTRGSQWRISLSHSSDAYLQVGRGSCASFTEDRANDDTFMSLNSRIDFAAGGGAYVIKVQGYRGAAGTYQLRIESRPGTASGGLLPAGGSVGPWLEPGWTPASVSSQPAGDSAGLRPGTIFKDCEDVCPELVVVPAGSFMMGSPENEEGRDVNESPRHAVAFAHPFAIGRYAVTFDEYDACVEAGGCSHRPNDQGWGRGRRPVIGVSWNDAQEYVAWLSEHTGRRYALPSEAEWEYAARAGTNTPWHTGQAILTEDANILNQFSRTVVVGGYPPNAFGLHDVHGNVGEWVLDCSDTGYIGVPSDGSAATAGDCAQRRVSRGGYFANEPRDVRSAARAFGAQSQRYNVSGFRVARAL